MCIRDRCICICVYVYIFGSQKRGTIQIKVHIKIHTHKYVALHCVINNTHNSTKYNFNFRKVLFCKCDCQVPLIDFQFKDYVIVFTHTLKYT